jgi:hypothetical protein
MSSVSALSAIRHPNVARILYVCTEDEPWCVISEYSDEGDLCQYLRKKYDSLAQKEDMDEKRKNNNTTGHYSNLVSVNESVRYINEITD